MLHNWVPRPPHGGEPPCGWAPGTSAAIRRCPRWKRRNRQLSEDFMATKENGQIVETATEARQAEPGPSVLALLTMSTGLAVLLMAVVWFVFFRT